MPTYEVTSGRGVQTVVFGGDVRRWFREALPREILVKGARPSAQPLVAVWARIVVGDLIGGVAQGALEADGAQVLAPQQGRKLVEAVGVEAGRVQQEDDVRPSTQEFKARLPIPGDDALGVVEVGPLDPRGAGDDGEFRLDVRPAL
jgi:hypothetical protein